MSRLYAKLNRNSEHYEDWKHVFGPDKVPLTGARQCCGRDPEGHMTWCYRIDLEMLGPAVRLALMRYLSGKYGVPVDTLDAEYSVVGVPILAEDVRL